MIEITSCGPCGANLIRWSPESVWTNSQTGQFCCPESATRRHHKNPDVGIVELPPEALAPMLVGVPWIDDVPIANAGYLGPDLSSDEGINLWPMDVDTFIRTYGEVDPYRTLRPGPRTPAFAYCCICGMILQPITPPGPSRFTSARWVDASGYGAACLGGQAHKVGRIHGVSGKITTDEENVEHGRCSGCGEEVTRLADGLWRNRDGFLACAPPPAPETARHNPEDPVGLCRWCRKAIKVKARDASGHAVWGRTSLGVDEPQLAFDLCEMAPDDMPHMPSPAVGATMPVNTQGLPTGATGATLHMPGDRRYSITPDEAVALIRDLAMTGRETHRTAARLLIREMMPNGHIMPQWEDLLDALGLLDIIPKNLDPRLSADGTAAQVWAGSFMVAEMDRDEILTQARALLDILATIKDEETPGE